MAIINTLREKMGRLLVVIVGLSILAFVLTDLLSQNSSLFGSSREVGEIDGEPISQEDFTNLVENLRRNYRITNSDPAMMQFVRQQAWNYLVNDIAFSKKLNELGIEIGAAERVDMVQGKNISPTIRNFFTQRIGSNDINTIRQYLTNISNNPNEQYIFASAEQQAMLERTRNKFVNMLSKTAYVSLAAAQQAYQQQLGFANVEYVYVPFSSVSDEQVGEISESEIRNYLDENKENYTVEESRNISYVSFPVTPSSEDSAAFDKQMDDLKSRLATTKNDSLFAISITEQGAGFNTYDPNALPVVVADRLKSLKIGDIIGPNLSNGIYTLHKLSGIIPTADEFARARQIVFKMEGLGVVEAARLRKTASKVLRQLRNGASFEDMARQHSQGDNKNTGGDLGWVKKGDAKIADVESAIFGATRKGLIRRLIQTGNNIYIVEVTETKVRNRYKVAQIIIEQIPSQKTIDIAYRKAGIFATSVDGFDAFDNYAAEKGYSVFSGSNIDKNANSIGRLSNARQIVSWLFRDADIGDVKDFDLNNEYVVAVYTGQTAAGVQPLSAVSSQIEAILKQEKKADFIKAKLDSLKGTISEIATAYGPEAKVYTNTALKLADTNLPNAGIAPEAVGAVFALQNPGDKTAAYIVDNAGVVMVELKSKSEAAEIGDYTSYENQLLQEAVNTVQGLLQKSVIDRVEVVDQRYKYF